MSGRASPLGELSSQSSDFPIAISAANAATLQPTALVNEVFIRLVKQSGVSWWNRAYFFGIAANVMRRILVEPARARNAWGLAKAWLFRELS